MKQNTSSEYQHALELLQAINAAILNNPNVHRELFFKGYNIWHFHQQNLFRDIVGFLRYKENWKSPMAPSLLSFLKAVILSVLATCLSMLACIDFILRRKKVLLYSVDKANSQYGGDVRIEALYEFLTNSRISFVEIFHSLLGKEFLSNFFRRKRAGIYLECIDGIFFLLERTLFFRKDIFRLVERINISTTDERESVFVKILLTRYLNAVRVSRFRIRVLSAIFKISGINILLAIDDVRYYHEVILACSMNAIKTFAFQHGRFNKYLVGWINYGIDPKYCVVPDALFVWNKFWKEKLVALSPTFHFYQGRIHIGGKPFLDTNIRLRKGKDDGITTILIPYEVYAPENEVKEYIKEFLGCQKTNVILKLRSDISSEEQMRKLALGEFLGRQNFKVVTHVHIEEWNKVDVVAGTYSTLLYEAVEAGIKTVVMRASSTQADDLIEDGFVNEIDLAGGGVCKKLEDIIHSSEIQIAHGKNMLKTEALIGNTLKQICNL